MYTLPMKRLQIYIEEELDEALAVEAARTKRSKAAVIRALVRDGLGGGDEEDPFEDLIGSIDDEAGDIDAVVYES